MGVMKINTEKPIPSAGSIVIIIIIIISLFFISLSVHVFSQPYGQELQPYPFLAMAKIGNNTVNQNSSSIDNSDKFNLITTNQTSFIDQDSNSFTKEGDSALYDFKYDEAISYYDKALAIEPNNTNALYGEPVSPVSPLGPWGPGGPCTPCPPPDRD